jgi:hypothetical protein
MKKIKVSIIFSEASAGQGNFPHCDFHEEISRIFVESFDFAFSGIGRKHYEYVWVGRIHLSYL